ncbi:MAG TPA: hypothetical protein IGS40_01450 [Trichormus sp. M33_DOE_039]|nr:hypothetical protein [Trichormus sp. M33_DOE_039]
MIDEKGGNIVDNLGIPAFRNLVLQKFLIACQQKAIALHQCDRFLLYFCD